MSHWYQHQLALDIGQLLKEIVLFLFSTLVRNQSRLSTVSHNKMAASSWTIVLLTCLACVNYAVLRPSKCLKVSQRKPEVLVNNTLCPMNMTVDEVSWRIPRQIVNINCIPSATCNCAENRECVQLRSTMVVYYFDESDSREVIHLNRHESHQFEYNFGCVCADLRTQRANSLSHQI